jgi:hypothetical protein
MTDGRFNVYRRGLIEFPPRPGTLAPGGTPQVRERHSRIQLAELAKRGAFDV